MLVLLNNFSYYVMCEFMKQITIVNQCETISVASAPWPVPVFLFKLIIHWCHHIEGNVWSLDLTFISNRNSGLKLKLIRIHMRNNNVIRSQFPLV